MARVYFLDRGLRRPQEGSERGGGLLVAQLVLHATFLHFHVLVIQKYSLPIVVHILQRSPLLECLCCNHIVGHFNSEEYALNTS